MPPLRLYARAVLPSLPLVAHVPGLRKAAGDPADLELRRTGVRVDREHLRAYARVIESTSAGTVPGLYPHVAAFELQLRLMVDRRFPFPPLGLVHIDSAVRLHRVLAADEVLDLACRPSRVRQHTRGRTVDIDTTVSVDGETVWEETMTLLSRGYADRHVGGDRPPPRADPPATDVAWDLPADLGRRYASVSGDRNPIHLYPLAAKAFGFPGTIAHGMWTAARAMAHVEDRLSPAYRYDMALRSPLLLPSRVRAGVRTADDGSLILGVVSSDGRHTHLLGRVRPA